MTPILPTPAVNVAATNAVPKSSATPAPAAKPMPLRPRLGADALALTPAARQALDAARTANGYVVPIETTSGSFNRVERDPRRVNAKIIFDRVDRGMEIDYERRAKGLPALTYDESQPLIRTTSYRERADRLREANKLLATKVLEAQGDSIRELKVFRIEEAMGDDPQAKVALQAILLAGHLDKKAPRAADGRGLLEILDGLARAPVPAGYDRAALLADLVQEIADPAAISQEARSTCSVTSIQIMIADTWPAEYARIVADLATKGTCRTAGQADLVRSNAAPTSGTRTQSAALFQAACMEYGNGDDAYDDANDRSGKFGRGLGPGEIQRVLLALCAAPWTYQEVEKIGVDEVLRRATPALAAGRPVPSAFTWADDLTDKFKAMISGHALLLTGIHEGRLWYRNPHGAEESMTLADARIRLRGVFLDERDLPAAK